MNYNEIITFWKAKNIHTIDELEQILSNFRIIFAYNSGAIENSQITYHNTREIFENGKVVNFTGDLRTIYEIGNQKDCYDYLVKKIINKEPLSPDLIKAIHKNLTKGTYDERRWERGERPGEYKKHDYVVGNDQGALPEEVAGEIEELCDEVKDIPDRGENIIKTAAYIHCKFENTHPFADGNGRVGRTLMNYYLMIHNFPPLVIFNETKDRYYAALDHYDKTGEIAPFVNHMKDCMENTWTRRCQQKSIESLKLDMDLIQGE